VIGPTRQRQIERHNAVSIHHGEFEQAQSNRAASILPHRPHIFIAAAVKDDASSAPPKARP
jgi:hypothetical protein